MIWFQEPASVSDQLGEVAADGIPIVLVVRLRGRHVPYPPARSPLPFPPPGRLAARAGVALRPARLGDPDPVAMTGGVGDAFPPGRQRLDLAVEQRTAVDPVLLGRG